MIIGYQIEDKHGRNWHDNIDRSDGPRTVLTQKSAISELGKIKITRPERGFKMIAVLEGDIENPIFENALASSPDQYKTLALSSGHFPISDFDGLEKLAGDFDCNMIMGRNTGWFVKLYDEAEQNLGYDGMSDEFHEILNKALAAGYRMVEIDEDADYVDSLEINH